MRDGSNWYDGGVYAAALGPLHLLPEVRRRETLHDHGHEEPYGYHPGYGENDVYDPPMPSLHRESEEEGRDRGSNARG